MEKPIDLALKEAVAAHKENNLQKARQLYDAILKAQPDHPDANYQLALFILATDKPEAAIPFLEKAATVKPSTEQYWLAYIEGLLIANRLDDTLSALNEAKLCGISPKALHRLEKQLQFISSHQSIKAKHEPTDRAGSPKRLISSS